MKNTILYISGITFLYLFFRVFIFAKKKKNQWICFSLLIIYCLVAFVKDGGPDYLEYEKMYESAGRLSKDGGLNLDNLIGLGKDINFSLWVYTNALFGIGFSYVILLSAFLSLNTKRLAWRNLELDTSVAISVWFFTYYFILDLTQIRAAIAVAFCFVALGHSLSGARGKYFFFMLIAVGFHAQAAIFLLCSLPLILKIDFNFKLKLIVVLSFLYSLSISIFLKYYAEIDSRPGILDVSSDFPLNGIIASLINLCFLCFLFYASLKSVTYENHLRISKVSFVFVVVGFYFLIFNLHSSSALAWRSYEMFNCFGVILVTVVLTQSKNYVYKLVGIFYIILNFILNLRSSLVF